MNWTGLVAVAVAVLVAVVPLGAAAGPGLPATDAVDRGSAPDAQPAGGENDTANASEPGARLAGVLGSQGAELDGEVESRSLAVRLRGADSPDAKAAVVADAAAGLEARLAALRERKANLTAAYRNGTLSRAAYRAKVAALAARVETVERMANRTSRSASRLPEETRREHGVNVTAVERLQANASELGDGEVAATAREVAGRDRGASASERRNGSDPPGGEGGPANDSARNGGSEKGARGSTTGNGSGGGNASAPERSAGADSSGGGDATADAGSGGSAAGGKGNGNSSRAPREPGTDRGNAFPAPSL